MSTRGTLLVVCLLGGCNFVFGIDSTDVVNRNPRPMILDNSASATDITSLPMLVQLNPSRIDYEVVSDPSTELRFHDVPSGQDLAFEVEHWEDGGDSAVWVLVPQIAARSTDHVIEMHFGPGAGGAESIGSVWGDYDLVVHGSTRGFGSSVGAFTPRPMGATLGDGVAGGALELATDNAAVEIDGSEPLLDAWSAFTLEFWISPDDHLGGNLFVKQGTINLPRLESWPQSDPVKATDIVWHQIDIAIPGCQALYINTLIPVLAWTHLVWTWDGRAVWLYRNGTIDDVALCDAGPLEASPETLRIGGESNSFHGRLDEFRIGRVAHGRDWIRAHYLAMTGGFARFPEPGEPIAR